MSWRRSRLFLVGSLLLVGMPAMGSSLVAAAPAVAATTCDAYVAGTSTAPTSVSESPSPIALSGSLAPGSTVTVTAAVTDAAGNCVSGAPVELLFTGSGSAFPDTAADCPVNSTLSLTPNWTKCWTDGSGNVTIVFQTPSTLPNGGSSELAATTTITSSALVAQAITSYTYASISISANAISATEGETFSGVVATMTTTDLTSIPTATIDWGDGTSSVGTVVGTSLTGNFLIEGTHAYQEEYPTGVTVSVIGSATDAPTVTGMSSATVADAPLSATGTSLNGRVHHLITGAVAIFSDADPAGTVTDYSATVYWGDGTYSTGSIVAGSSGFTVSASHTYTRRGTYTITVDIVDVGGSATTTYSSATIR
jgi:hypothetical protein